jgi:UDPglucose--hexose-1-phosphate uridylyltransferase
MKEVYDSIDRLIDYAKKNLQLDERNEDYVRNGIFRFLGLDAYNRTEEITTDQTTPEKLLSDFSASCVKAGLFTPEESEYYCDEVMGELSLSPKAVEDTFYQTLHTDGSQNATEWLYTYAVKNDYVKKSKLDQNPRFDSDGLVITINKAKPEFRDPKKAQSGNATKGGYPKCSICHENEGFAGRNKRTLRTVNLTLGGQNWFWQFSPYGYFYQHGIAVNYTHTPMHVDRSAFARLMDFVDLFPHYFIGCNAALPRIGGSVLAHDHYQGGGEILPMHKAKAWKSFHVAGGTVEVVDWSGTVVRIVSPDRAVIENLSEKVRKTWITYRNDDLGIIPEDEQGVHNAVSPTVVKTARGYEMSIILRSNITSSKYPDGVFHAHPEFHVIKKESIGLIEAQGLFILPGRLEKELGEIERLIEENQPLPPTMSEFEMVYEETKEIYRQGKDVKKAMREELGNICNRILENTAVFKDRAQTVEFLKLAGVI